MTSKEALEYLIENKRMHWIREDKSEEALKSIKKDLDDFEWIKSKFNFAFLESLDVEDRIKILSIMGLTYNKEDNTWEAK